MPAVRAHRGLRTVADEIGTALAAWEKRLVANTDHMQRHRGVVREVQRDVTAE